MLAELRQELDRALLDELLRIVATAKLEKPLGFGMKLGLGEVMKPTVLRRRNIFVTGHETDPTLRHARWLPFLRVYFHPSSDVK